MAHLLSILFSVLFWIYFVLIYNDLPAQLKPDVYKATLVILLTTRYFVLSGYEIPTVAFWILFVLILPTVRTNSRGTCFFPVLIVQGLEIKPDGVNFPGLHLHPLCSYHIVRYMATYTQL